MTDRASNTASMRVPLQENLGQNMNIHRRQSLSNITNQNVAHKLASDGSMAKPTFVAPFARRGPSVNALVAEDRDISRPRIALQQKPLNSNTANIRALQPPSSNTYKLKQTAPAPSLVSSASKHSTLSYPPRETIYTQAQHYPSAHHGLKNAAPSYPSRCDTVGQTQPSNAQHSVRHSIPPDAANPNAALQAQAPEAPVKDNAAAQDPLQFQAPVPAYGSKEWIDGLVQILPRCKFYYDCVDQAMAAKLTKVLHHYRAHVTMFFSLDVTHIVTTNYIPRSKTPSQNTQLQPQTPTTPTPSLAVPGKLPMKPLTLPPNPNTESNILVKALSHGIRIWSLERMVNLLNPLVGGRIAKTGQQLENRNLQDFLQHEKVYGLTTTQNDDSPRAEYHVLKDHYILVEDVSGYYRTILAQEFPREAPKYGGAPWPRLYVQPHSNRSPFVFAHDRSKRTKKPKETVKNKDETAVNAEEGQKGQEIPVEATATAGDTRMMPSVPASGIINSVTSNAISTTSAMGKPVAVQGLQTTLDQLGKRVLNATKGEAGVPPVVKTSEFVHPGSIIRANKTTADADSVSLKKQPLAAVDMNTANPDRSKHPHMEPVQDKALDAQPPKEKQAEGTATRTAVPKDYRNKGYCENCRQLYDDFNAHTATPEHRRYAHDSSKFAQLDKLLLALQRKPKAVPVHTVAESKDQGQESGVDASPSLINNDPPLVVVGEQHAGLTLNSLQGTTTSTQPHSEFQNISEHYSKSAIPAVARDMLPQNNETVKTEDREKAVDPGAKTADVPCATEGNTADAKESVRGQSYEDQAEDAEDFDDQLSSEMSRLDVTEADDQDAADTENDDRLIQMPSVPSTADDAPRAARMSKDASVPNRLQRLREKPAFRDQLRLPCSDMGGTSENHCVSQTDTDATQPDDRFLQCSGMISIHTSQITDPVPQIELAISLTDGPEASEDPAADDFKLDEANEANESDKEGADDGVALLKSPSAGRGAFAKAQGAMLRQAMGLPLGQAAGGQDPMTAPDRELTSGLSKGALKRKLENVLAEERGYEWSSHMAATGDPQTPGTPRPQQPAARPIVYDDSLRSRLLQQSATPQRPLSWPNQRQFATLPLPPAPPMFTPPKSTHHQRRSQQPSPGYHHQRHVGTDDTSDTIPLPSFGGSEAEGSATERYDSELRSLGSNGGYPTTPLSQHRAAYDHQQQQHQQQQQLQQQYYSQRNYSNHHLPKAHRSNVQYHSSPPVSRPSLPGHAQPSRRGVEITVNDGMSRTHSPRSALPTSSTSPMSYHHFDMQQQQQYHSTTGIATTPTPPPHARSQSPTDSTYSGSGSGDSSPSRSPSQRSKIYRMQKIPTMSHAEQERERCYHHYRGNRLPESAGQKKVKSSSGLEDEFEEYGEGCMVYIE
ncbi:hypothetical protein EC968_009285 [Mortierella alpina]|nr:hypothetical protein EC968_009285 [Mortierella alpina]